MGPHVPKCKALGWMMVGRAEEPKNRGVYAGVFGGICFVQTWNFLIDTV
jgi:hypothetical protein